MKILGINGSPRAGGNTDILLDKALEGARAAGALVEKIVLNKLDFCACRECENLSDDGSCIIEDEMQPVYKKVKKADAVILASPVFFGSLSAQAKMMIDRFQCAWRAKYLLKKDIYAEKKIGAFISVQASDKKAFFENARQIVKNIFTTLNISYQEELFCAGADEKGDILKQADCLEKAYTIGEKLAKTEVT